MLREPDAADAAGEPTEPTEPTEPEETPEAEAEASAMAAEPTGEAVEEPSAGEETPAGEEPPEGALAETPPSEAADGPLTTDEFTAQFNRLADRARAAGIRPLLTMDRAYVRQGMAIIESLLQSLDEGNSKKKD